MIVCAIEKKSVIVKYSEYFWFVFRIFGEEKHSE